MREKNLYVLTGILLIGLAVILPHVSATIFNLTATVDEKYIYWQFDNNTYNIAIDGANATEFTGSGYLVTNLQRNTMHMISIANASNASESTLDYQMTDKAFWDTNYFIFLIIGIACILFGVRIPMFTIISILPIIASLYFGMQDGFNWFYLSLPVFIGVVGAVRWMTM